eukprot:UN18138
MTVRGFCIFLKQLAVGTDLLMVRTCKVLRP